MAISASKTLTMITKYGADAVFRTYPSSTYARGTGKTTLGAATDYTHKVLEGEASKAFRQVDGVPDADLILYLSPSGLEFTPTVPMTVVYDSATWTVIAQHHWKYKGSVVLYELALNGMGS